MRRFSSAVFIALVAASTLAIGGVGIALALENHDPFCASCHTEPETTYVRRASQARAIDLAAYHAHKATHCIDCHSGAGTFGRAHGLQQGAKDMMSFVRGTYRQPAITINPLGDEACVKCHIKVYERPPGAGKAGLNHYHFYLPQWSALDTRAPRCVACHAPHITGSEGLKFMQQGKVGKLCEDCHDALSGVVR